MENVLTPREFINVELDENLQEGHEDSGCTFIWSTIWILMEDYHKYRATAESLNDAKALPIPDVSDTLPEMSCALCGYFCNNYHHFNNWFEIKGNDR